MQIKRNMRRLHQHVRRGGSDISQNTREEFLIASREIIAMVSTSWICNKLASAICVVRRACEKKARMTSASIALTRGRFRGCSSAGSERAKSCQVTQLA